MVNSCRRGLQGGVGAGEDAGPGPQPEPHPPGAARLQDREGVPAGGPGVPRSLPTHLWAVCQIRRDSFSNPDQTFPVIPDPGQNQTF